MERTQALLQAAQVRLRPILMTTLAMVFGMLPLALALSEGSEQRAPMGQAVIGGVITSSLLTLVVVPVIYCWLDDLAPWAAAPLVGRARRCCSAARRPRILAESRLPTPGPHAMNIEQARFNMIEQQIRPWDVLDPGVLSLLAVVQARGLRAAGATARWPSSTPRCRCRRRGQCMLAPRSRPGCCRSCRCSATRSVLEIGAGSGFMAALLAHRAQQVITLEIRAGRWRAWPRDNLRRAGVINVTVRRADGAQGLPGEAPFDAIVLSGSVAEVPQALLEQLKVGGRLVAIVGDEPVMRAALFTRVGDDARGRRPTCSTPWRRGLRALPSRPVQLLSPHSVALPHAPRARPSRRRACRDARHRCSISPCKTCTTLASPQGEHDDPQAQPTSTAAAAARAAAAGAEPVPAPAQAQSLQELYEAARAYDATYLAARAQAEAAEYRAAQAEALGLPTLSANVSGVRTAQIDLPRRDVSGDTNAAADAALNGR